MTLYLIVFSQKAHSLEGSLQMDEIESNNGAEIKRSGVKSSPHCNLLLTSQPCVVVPNVLLAIMVVLGNYENKEDNVPLV